MTRGAIVVSGGAGYIGSHASFRLRELGYTPVVVDNLATGNEWAASFGPFELGDIGDADFVRAVCERYRPLAAMHFAAFIEVGESVRNPAKYFENNRDKARVFFGTLYEAGVRRVVFSSTAAVYGEVDVDAPIAETTPTRPINPYGQSKLDAEEYLRSLDARGMRSVALRYFNVVGAAPNAGIGESHAPESHLFPRLLLPVLGLDPALLDAIGLHGGFTIYGTDYATPDGTAIRDYVHVMDLIDAHVRALDYLASGGATDAINLGSGSGYSVMQIVDAVRSVLGRSDFAPGIAARRGGDPAMLVAASEKAARILGWKPARSLADSIADAAAWHRSERYARSVRERVGGPPGA